MENFIAQHWEFLSIFLTIDLIIVLLIIYFVKERREEKAFEKIQTVEHHPEGTVITDRTITKKTSKIKTKIGKSRILTNIPGKVTQIKVTGSMIDALRNLETGSWLMKTMIQKIIPADQLQEITEKALKGELEEGMVVSIRDGQITIEKDDPSVL